MIYAEIDTAEREALNTEMKRATDVKWYRRLKIIDLSSQGYSVPELVRLFDLGEGTIRRYIHDDTESSRAGLQPSYGRGRLLRPTWVQAEWLNLLAQSPDDCPALKTAAQNWIQALLLQYLATYHQIDVTQTTLSKALHRVSFRWRRVKRRVHSPDPLYVVKRQRASNLQQLSLSGDLTSEATAHPRSDESPKPATLVFLNSTDRHSCPHIGNTYTPTGQQLKVDTPGLENPWLALFGSLYYPSGEGLYTVHHHMRAADLLEHLQLLIDSDSDRFWFVVFDNTSAHSTEAVGSFAAQHWVRLEFVYLPTSSLHLNLIERLWRFVRSQVTRNRFDDSLAAVVKAAVDWLQILPFAHFCSRMCIDMVGMQFVTKPFS